MGIEKHQGVIHQARIRSLPSWLIEFGQVTLISVNEINRNSVLDYLVLRPGAGWPGDDEIRLSNGVSLGNLPTDSVPNFFDWSESLSGREMRFLSENRRWFYYRFKDVPTRPTDVQNTAFGKVVDATYALVILAPAGNNGIRILCNKEDQNWKSVTIIHDPEFRSTPWGNIQSCVHIGRSDLTAVVNGVTKVSTEGIIRLLNPLQFLEHGLQSRNIHLRIFLWVTGLDALVMAGNRRNFINRMIRLLGRESFVFPEAEFFGQPKYRIEDVLEDLYELRSCIAHGQEIPEKFRKESGFPDTSGKCIELYKPGYTYRGVLEECSLFMLCRALRTVFLSRLVPTVVNTKEWRRFLET